MYALIISDANISGFITGEFNSIEEAEEAGKLVEDSAGQWLSPFTVPELDLKGVVLFDEPVTYITDAGTAQAEGLLD